MPVSLVPSYSYSPPIRLLLKLPLFSFEVMEALAAHGPTEEQQLFHRLVCCHWDHFPQASPTYLQFISVAPSCQNHEAPTLYGNNPLFTLHLAPGTVHNLYLLHLRHSTLSSPGQISICPTLALSCKPLS